MHLAGRARMAFFFHKIDVSNSLHARRSASGAQRTFIVYQSFAKFGIRSRGVQVCARTLRSACIRLYWVAPPASACDIRGIQE